MIDSAKKPRVLVVEDEALVAMSICDDLNELGWLPVGPYANLADAAQAAVSETFDVALVDINLHNEMSYPLIGRLMERKVPTALVTAYSEDGIPDRFKTLLLMKKPYSLAGLSSLLDALTAKVRTSGRLKLRSGEGPATAH